MPGIVQNPKKLRPLKGMSTCEGEEPPICPSEPSLMDYCPVPEGSWKEKYDKDNKEAYRDLALGFASLILSIVVVGLKHCLTLFFIFPAFGFLKRSLAIGSTEKIKCLLYILFPLKKALLLLPT